MISRALEAEILRLYHTEHWPIGTIATQLRVHHTTVRRVLAPTGVPTAQKTVRPSMVEPYLAFILEMLTNRDYMDVMLLGGTGRTGITWM